MKLVIDISDRTYDSIMARDWKNAGWLFGEDLKAIHDGIPLDGVLHEIRQEITNLVKTYPFTDHMDAYVKEEEVLAILDKHLENLKSET